MTPTAEPGRILAAGLGATVVAALAPAGLRSGSTPMWSWVVWAAVVLSATAMLRAAPRGRIRPAATLAWVSLPVLLLTVPTALLAEPGRRWAVAAALMARSLAASSAALATVTYLGPAGTVEGLRALRVPAHLVDVVHAMLVALAAVGRQVAGMQRARAARRGSSTPASSLAAAPIETARGFGRMVGALFLRSMERAEALERARRARGGIER